MSALRLIRECDLFRKLPQEHQKGHQEEKIDDRIAIGLRIVTFLMIGLLSIYETADFMTVSSKQRFDIDMSETTAPGSQKKMRVRFNITVHDFECGGLSLDYQDVMGTRAVDVKTTVFKRRMHKNGTEVDVEHEANDPKSATTEGKSNAGANNRASGNSTCGSCYGALPDGECCNSCSDVLYAYRLKRWALPRIESIEQCKTDGDGKPRYQPPQIIRLDEYSYDDYLPKYTKISSMQPQHAAATPFRLNLTFEPLNLTTGTYGGQSKFSPFKLNFTSNPFGQDNYDDYDDFGYDDLDDFAFDRDGRKRRNETAKPWPDCILRNVIIHGYDIGEALMVDMRKYGAKEGCWNSDCSETDKFSCDSIEKCAEVCEKIHACRWWTHGDEDGLKKCWIRTARHGRGKRLGFSSGPRSCHANASNFSNATSAVSNASAASKSEAGAPEARRMSSFADDDDFYYSRPPGSSFGSYMPVFGWDSRDRPAKREPKDESCQIYGYFDTNKVQGNFHIGTHGIASPSYLSYFDEERQSNRNMVHTIHSLVFLDIETNDTLNDTQPLDGFESPKAFTFQYYLMVTPGTMIDRLGRRKDGYQFKAGSYVTNELIGPAVFFRLDLDPIRVTYYYEEVRWSKYLLNICAVVGGCVALCSMISQLFETAVHLNTD
eukprot:gnl/TRDRNA2_/TRDRNA2_35695_c0_seq1.p1 gnl/TRDRNA2_/TRDRNA2_35695_c0~~gnl/TRDRNA2_/TRDRNA2_35695_c0_seq1.p1  ORF type:complete len:659 (+),score=104.32 gnl/TRDRNA2_/TRDRNA2_35695_c0_seq1:120-2096(+)